MIFEKTQTVRIAGRLLHSAVNGPGVRYVLFFQGCIHHCRDCQNPETWEASGGTELTVSEITEELQRTRYLDGITLSGGDPLLQPLAAGAIASAAREMGLSVWCYTGYTFEELLSGIAGQDAFAALAFMDVLVDGRFLPEERTEDALYRGSANQRLIDLPKSISERKVHVVSSMIQMSRGL